MELLYTQCNGFQECAIPEGQGWLENESDRERAKRLGWQTYYSTSDWADFLWESMIVWTTKEPTHPMVAELCVGNHGMEIWFPSRADFVHYWHQFAPVRTAQLNNEIHAMHEMAHKMFQAQHGHSGDEHCRECAPIQWTIDQRRKRMRADATAKGWDPGTEPFEAFIERHGMREWDYR